MAAPAAAQRVPARTCPSRRKRTATPLRWAGAAVASVGLLLAGCAGAEPTVLESPTSAPDETQTAAAPEYTGGEDLTDEQRADVEAVITMLDEYSVAIVDAYADPETGRDAIREYVDEPFLSTVHSELDELVESEWFMDGEVRIDDLNVEHAEPEDVSITACVDTAELRAYSDPELTQEIDYNVLPLARMRFVASDADGAWKIKDQTLAEEGCAGRD